MPRTWPTDDYARYLAGKRVALVGPAPTVEASAQGAQIDAHDVVVRLNHALPIPARLTPDIGGRTDVLYHNLWPGSPNAVPHVYPVLGRPLAFYPMAAAKSSRLTDRWYVSTDSPEIMAVARFFNMQIIERPAELSQDTSELTDALVHALGVIGSHINYLITMHCNCAIHRDGLVDECISLMNAHPEADSCVTGFVDHSVHPFRTKRVDADGYLQPWLDIPEGTSTNRQSLSTCFILDGAVRVLRVSRCFPPRGQRPFTYLGSRILHVLNAHGSDVHSLDDIADAERALGRAGVTPAP